MSLNSENGVYEDDIEVKDEEKYTDRKVKQRILNTRQMLNEAKFELFAGRLTEPDVEISDQQALFAWSDLVRSYIRDLGVLLNHDDIGASQRYRENVKIGEVTVIPPDKDGYQFSLVAYDEYTDKQLRRKLGLGRGAEIPHPKTKSFEGLMSVIQTPPVIEKHWLVTTNPQQAGPNQNDMPLTARKPVPRHIYEQALVEADQFLQGAGIGLDIEAGDYMGGDEPGL